MNHSPPQLPNSSGMPTFSSLAIKGDDGPGNGMDIWAIFGFVQRQIWVMLSVSSLLTALAMLFVFQLTPHYTARALIQIDYAAQRLTDSEASSIVFSTSTAFVAGQENVIVSDAVLRRAVRQLGIGKRPEYQKRTSLLVSLQNAVFGDSTQPVSEINEESRIVELVRGNLRVRRIGLTFNIEVEYTSIDPVFAANVANGVVNSYTEVQVEKKIASARHASAALKQRVHEVSARLTEVEKEISDFLSSAIGNTGSGSTAEIQRLNDEIMASVRERDALTRTLDTTRSALQKGDLADAAARVGSLSANPNMPQEVIDLSKELARIVEQREKAARADADKLTERANGLAASAQELITKRLASVSDRENAARLQLKVLLTDANGGVELFRLQSEAEAARSIYRVALDLLKRAEIGSDIQVPDARIVSEATPPVRSSYPPKGLFFALSALFGIGLGACLGLIREWLFTGFVSAAQVEQTLKLPVVSTVPYMDDHEHAPHDEVLVRPLSPFSESLRRWRIALDAAAPADEALTILITSAVPAEGKSTLALSLARLYSSSGKRTIIIDCDLRRPSLSKLVDFGDSPNVKVGVSDFLRRRVSKSSVKEFVCFDRKSGLAMLLGKPSIGEATDVPLSSRAFADMLAILRGSFDVIILDSPPLVHTVDARILMKHADIVTQVVRWGATSPSLASAAARDIRMPGNPMGCVVLNQSQEQNGLTGYRYSYSYSYTTGYGEERAN